jgi:hypothetical protein
MWWDDPDAAGRDGECRYVREFRQIATDSILAHLTEATTPQQYQLALASLLALRDECMGRIDAFHRSALYGRHRCLAEAYLALRRKLEGAMVLRPVPQPESAPEPAPPAPPPKPRTLRAVLEGIAREPTEDNGR